KGHRISVLDFRVCTKSEIENFLNSKIDIYGISVCSFTINDALKLINMIGKEKSHRIILGGPHVSIADKGILNNKCIDYAIRGEGEFSFPALIDLIQRGDEKSSALHEIPGLIYRENGNVKINENKFISEPDDLPYPDYSGFSMDRYNSYPIITSRGCPFKCEYCASHIIWGRKWRARTPENIVGEIDYLIKEWGRKEFIICDDTFNLDIDRAISFCNLLIQQNKAIKWDCWGIRADKVSGELIDVMRRAGCIGITIGIESSNPKVLKNINKGETIHQIKDGIKIIKRNGVRLGGSFMIGNKGDTLDSVKETVRFARRSGLDGFGFYHAAPYPKTKLLDYVEKNGKYLTNKDYTHYSHFEDSPIFETPDFTAEERIVAWKFARRTIAFKRIMMGIKNQKLELQHRGLFNYLINLSEILPRILRTAFSILFPKKKAFSLSWDDNDTSSEKNCS
ncbi:B12-binding domain-containing radical SAM protein, partial [Thermodesulfobacteriota bacterium]